MKVLFRETIGGLGDAIVYSTLPELYAAAGHEFYLHPDTKARNPEVYELLYHLNPFVRGVNDESGEWIQAGNYLGKEHFRLCRVSPNPIGLIERLHGFEPIHDRPQIYYQPKHLSEWSDVIVIDPRSISQPFPPSVFDRWVRRTLYSMESNPTCMVVESKHAGPNGSASVAHLPRYQVENIYEYIDMIYSCKAFLCTESGGQSIAAAVREKDSFALCTTMTYNSRFFIYPNVIYSVTGSISNGNDYIPNDEIGI